MNATTALSRRAFLVGSSAVSALALGGCVTTAAPPAAQYTAATAPAPQIPIQARLADIDPMYLDMYGPLDDGRFTTPGIDLTQVNPAYLRKAVDYSGPHGPGAIVVDPNSRYLYLVGNEGRAMRYGAGVGRDGFAWSGNATVKRKAEWPDWYPPAEMIKRKPELEEFADGMPGGPDNPLGARALYLYDGDRDTMFRIHGTNEPWTIGTASSSGCIRLINQDVIDLYRRVPANTKVVVLGSRIADGAGIVVGRAG